MSPIPNKNTTAALVNDDWSAACRESSNAEVESQTYFVTMTCYGTWLHGNARGSVDREHNDWLTPPLEPDEERERQAFALLKHAPVKFGPRQRQAVFHAIQEVCQHRGWRLHAVNVRTNHVHIVVTANRRGKQVMNDFKSYATRQMKESQCLPESCLEVFHEPRQPRAAPVRKRSPEDAPKYKVWTRGGSARPIDTENSFRRAIEYTLHEQGIDLGTSKAGEHLEPRP